MNCPECKHHAARDWVKVGGAHLGVYGCPRHLGMLKAQLSRSLLEEPESLPTPELIELGNKLARRLDECHAELNRRAEPPP